MMKVLLVSSTILPQSGGSSIIVENLAKNFSQEEMLVFGGRGLINKTENIRPSDGVKFIYFFTELSLLGRGARFFDWFRKLRISATVRKIEKIIEENQISHVIGVYPNIFYCLAAARAAKRKNIPFSSYFHNTYVDNVAVKDPDAPIYQQEIFDSSQHIFVMSEGMQSFYEEKYKIRKFSPLLHTFDKYPDPSTLKGIAGKPKSKYKLVAIGNFNESNLEASRRFVEAIKDQDRYELSIYTHVPKILLQKRGMDPSFFKYMGAVRPDQVHEELQKYDICILTHGFEGGYGEVEYRTIFPTRTIPFLLSGKPIVAHSPKGSFLNNFISKYQCAELIDGKSTHEIIRGLDKVADSIEYQKELISNAKKASGQFHSPQVIRHFNEVLQSSKMNKTNA